ncbi:class A beta-lactamase-related serine hydrolase [Mesobaculum littorinae]|uniref:Class A beta-lactamase-related serine hydrolase n=2 Tax=Mesobaculum littorinae TaxID=2486419 RepID=A0A438AF34_9RHOB|nr:class A beta-lactamase-related serine hydrolase [Mesobaculum littorinae]
MLAPPASLMAQAADESMTRLLDSAIDSAIDENRVVGAVVLVSHDGELVYHRAAGMADTAAGITMTEDTIFRLSSLSKPIVTAAAMRLVDDGILDLDAPVTDWLPDFRPGFDGETPVITLRQLLSHTSGVSYRGFEFGSGPYTDAGVQDGAFGTGITLEENVTRIATAPLTFEPGTGWGYGLGVDVIGRVIEVATNLPLEVAVRDLVTGPLGMSATGFHVPVWEESRLSVSYRDAENGPVAMSDHEWVPFAGTVAKVLFEPPRATDPDAWPSAGAGMSGTPPDFLELLETFRPAQSFFSDEALMAMYQPVAGEDAASNGPGWGFGIGGAILIDPEKSGTPQPEGTFSWSGAYGHTWFIDPENNLVVVAMTNTTWEGMSGQFSIDIRNAVYGN